MPDQNASQLAAVVTPQGTDLLYCIQGGVDKGITLAQIVGAGTSPGSFTTLAASGISTLQDDVKITAAKKLYLDGGGDTYIHEPSADVVAVVVGGVTGLTLTEAGAAVASEFSGTLTATEFIGPLTGNVTGSSGSCTGNAATATALATARAINGVNFDGTAAITVTAAAETLTGTTLKSTVVTSSLTAIGTLASGAVPASLVTAGTLGTGAYVFDNSVTGITALGVTTSVTLTGTAGAAGIDINPGSDIDADLITVGVNGTPKLWWDEDPGAITSSANFAASDFVGTIGGTTPAAGAFTTLGASDDVQIAATKKIYLDGGTHTYISESAADVLTIHVGGQDAIVITEANDYVAIGSSGTKYDLLLFPTGKLFFDAFNHTYIDESSNDVLSFTIGAVVGLTLTEAASAVAAAFSGTLAVTTSISSAFPNTDTGTGLLVTTDDGSVQEIKRDSSTARFKTNIETAFIDPAAVLALTPKRYGRPGGNRNFLGFIVEDFEDAGFGDILGYDPDGRPASFVEFGRGISALQQVVLQDHDARIAALEAELAFLKN